MIYSVYNSNLLLIWGSNLAINKATLILKLPILCTVDSILMEKLLSLYCLQRSKKFEYPTSSSFIKKNLWRWSFTLKLIRLKKILFRFEIAV